MPTAPDHDDNAAKVILALRQQMTEKERADFDKAIQENLRREMKRYQQMEQAVVAVGTVLHREGAGEKAGFCDECGQVMPCTTRKMLQPYLSRRT